MRCGYLSKQTDGQHIKPHITTHIHLKITKRENILIQQNLCYFRENVAVYFIYFIYFILQYLEGFKIITVDFKTYAPWTKHTFTHKHEY